MVSGLCDVQTTVRRQNEHKNRPLLRLGIYCIGMDSDFCKELMEESQEFWVSRTQSLLQECRACPTAVNVRFTLGDLHSLRAVSLECFSRERPRAVQNIVLGLFSRI